MKYQMRYSLRILNKQKIQRWKLEKRENEGEGVHGENGN